MTGSLASAIAVFISTPSQPSSIATAASDAVPTPASTSTGTLAPSTISRIVTRFWIPSPDPIGAPSGMIATAPASSSRLAAIGSSTQYTIGANPSLARISQARIVSTMSGYSVRASPSTSSFTRSHPPASRASRSVRIASSALKQPAVLGR